MGAAGGRETTHAVMPIPPPLLIHPWDMGHRTGVVVNQRPPPALWCVTAKGAVDMSLKISSFFAFVVCPPSLLGSAEPCTRVCCP